MDKITLKKIITDFQKYANNLMNTGFEKIRLSSANYEEYFLKQNSGFNSTFIIPEQEDDHVKVIYDYMDMIEKNNISYFNIKIIYPLIKYINIELSKKMMEYDDIYPVINFNGNNSPVYFQSQGNQNIEYINNDLNKINKLIDEIITSISNLKQTDVINIVDLIDDIRIMQEAINSSKPNIPRIKRIFEKISSCVNIATTTISGIAIISENLTALWQLIEKAIIFQ